MSQQGQAQAGAPDARVPRRGQPGEPLLVVDDLHTAFRTGRGTVRAVDGVSLTVDRGKTLGHRGRVRLGQDRAGPLDHGPAPPA